MPLTLILLVLQAMGQVWTIEMPLKLDILLLQATYIIQYV